MFSGTPGLPGIKLLLADAATNTDERCIMLADVKGAFLCGEMSRIVFIRLPP